MSNILLPAGLVWKVELSHWSKRMVTDCHQHHMAEPGFRCCSTFPALSLQTFLLWGSPWSQLTSLGFPSNHCSFSSSDQKGSHIRSHLSFILSFKTAINPSTNWNPLTMCSPVCTGAHEFQVKELSFWICWRNVQIITSVSRCARQALQTGQNNLF